MTRRATVVIAAEILGESVPVLCDAGLTVAGSLTARPGQVALVIEGDRLPDACEVASAWAPGPRVEVTFQKEHYGRQSIVRVLEVRLA